MAGIGAHVNKDRLNKWAFLLLFSILCLIAHETDDENKNTYVTVCTSVSLAFSFLASVLHLGTTGLSAFFVGTVVEGLTSLVLVALWGAALPIIMNPANGLAQMYVGKNRGDVADYQSTISNANLYFTTWGAGVCAVMILASYIRERLGGVGGAGMGYTTNWYLLMLASVIVIIECMRFKNQVCSIVNGTEGVTCGRNMYGLVTGCIGLSVSFLVSLFSSLGKDSALITTIFGFIMAILYTLCAGLMTFENGPATYVGNQYLSAWAGFFLSFAVFGSVLKEFLGAGDTPAAAAGTNGPADVEMDRI
ncbi:hypothetical protein ACHAXA_000408 [Cyclostephanos tholiformis]|uniref:Silicon transporter n=1 Tax=Cyclostephanos tholiformis TaxID=382380 RepID=A0ABD3REV1_9STRA